jgi:uncharacterized coiled-coil protein SlyX
MTIELTTEEKTAIIESHMKNCLYNQYNINISLIEEKTKSSLDQKTIDNLNSQLTDVTNQITALQNEILSLTPSQTTSN